MSPTVATKQKTWQIDIAHSQIEFNVSHMVISTITGFLKKFEGKITTDEDDFSSAKIELSIDASSIDTNHEQRDGHLKGPEFLDAEKHRNITFQSTSVKKVGDVFKVMGDFNLRGVSKPIELTVKHNGTIKDPYGNTRAGFKVSGSFNRRDFGVNWHATLDNGGLVAGDTVEIVGNIEVVLK